MASVNRVIIVGNLGKDVEMKVFPSGDKVANISVATTDKWKDKNTGENKESTEWHRITLHGKTADVAERFLKRGSSVYVEGSIRTRKWTDKDGQERYSTEIRADSMQMLGGKSEGQAPAPTQSPQPQRQSPAPRSNSGFDDDSGDIPW